MIIVSYISPHDYAHANTLYHNDMVFSTRAISDIYHNFPISFFFFKSLQTHSSNYVSSLKKKKKIIR